MREMHFWRPNLFATSSGPITIKVRSFLFLTAADYTDVARQLQAVD
jgi:hypothetical protein